MTTLEPESVDTVITDPPAGINFMGRKWDNKTGYVAVSDKGLRFLEFGELMGLEPWEAGFVAFMIDVLTEIYRVMKPGAMCLLWALPRTADLTGLAMRVAGLHVKDCVTHLFGSGFPKSMSISKALDRAAGAEREVVGKRGGRYKSPITDIRGGNYGNGTPAKIDASDITAPATPAAKLWDGYGTALKPAAEFWLLGMKPIDGTFANNAQVHGVSGLNIDGARILTGEKWDREPGSIKPSESIGTFKTGTRSMVQNAQGRFPSNLVLSHHPECVQAGVRRVKGSQLDHVCTKDSNCYGAYGTQRRQGHTDPDGYETIPAWECVKGCPIRELGEQSGILQSGAKHGVYNGWGEGREIYGGSIPYIHHCIASTGTAARYFLNLPGEARFFYCAKASRRERNLGLEEMPEQYLATMGNGIGAREHNPEEQGAWTQNNHPTVKPLALMEYLCTLTRTPAGGIVLDPFMGSGTTGIACVHTGRDFIGIEKEKEYFEIAQVRIEHAQNEMVQLSF